MAKIVRYNGNLVPFASASLGTERTIFGEVTQADDITSQYTAEFLRGWGIVGPSDQPTLQDFNAVSYTHGQILSYLHQVGVAEYNSTQEYHVGSLANVSGAIYSSLIDANVGNPPESSPSSWVLLNASLNIVGESRNLRCSIAAASASATFTADQVIVSESISGKSYRLSSFSKVINLATTGAGGMDAGAAPVSGWVAIYAIYNPVTGVSALLATNATSAAAPEIYGGANMPVGYTASALVSVWGTTAGSLLQIGKQFDRSVSVVLVNVLNIATTQPVFTSTNIANGAPPNAKRVAVTMNASSSVSATLLQQVSPDSVTDVQQILASNSVQSVGSLRDIKVLTPQVIFMRFTASAGTVTLIVSVSEYGF